MDTKLSKAGGEDEGSCNKGLDYKACLSDVFTLFVKFSAEAVVFLFLIVLFVSGLLFFFLFDHAVSSSLLAGFL